MDDEKTVSFMSIVAGLLICNSRVSAVDITNFISRFSSLGIEVDDGEDLSMLSVCVDVDKSFNFSLKKGFSYDTFLENGKSVFQFLEEIAGDDVLVYIKSDSRYCDSYNDCYEMYHGCVQVVNYEAKDIKVKRKIPIFSLQSLISSFRWFDISFEISFLF